MSWTPVGEYNHCWSLVAGGEEWSRDLVPAGVGGVESWYMQEYEGRGSGTCDSSS